MQLDSVRGPGNLSVGFIDVYGQIIEVNFVKATVTVAPKRGDLNVDLVLSPADVVLALICIFLDSPPPAGFAACDANCDGENTVADVMLFLNLIFREEALPC
jgi:hypothetical protein